MQKIFFMKLMEKDTKYNLKLDSKYVKLNTIFSLYFIIHKINYKVYKKYLLERVWGEGNLLTLLMGIQTIQPLCRTVWRFL